MAKGDLHTLTKSEAEIISRSVEDPDVFFDFWFRKKGAEKGWQLDYKFDDDQKWQKSMCMASQSFIVAICGIATGKSLGVVMSAAYHGITTPEFKFLNVAKEGWQSKLMHKALLEQAKDTPFENLIISYPTRPYPMIIFGYKIGDMSFTSTMEFMSLGEGGDATNIFSWRGDWINVEEAGRIENLSEIVGNLATRLTGVTASGREFLARMSIISNPWDNIELYNLYDMARLDKEDGLVFNIDTEANKNVSEKQVKLALKRIPEDQHERFLTGKRPEGRGGWFLGANVEACESEEMALQIQTAFNNGEKGYIVERNPVLGVWHFRVPRRDGHIYLMYGDPGTGAAPARNAPSILVFDVTKAHEKFVPIVGMWWGNGAGSIMPYTHMFLEFMRHYQPLEAGSDSTGTQKNTAELMNYDHVFDQGYSVDYILPMTFASGARYTYLAAARLTLDQGIFSYPRFLYRSLSSQLKNYDDQKDRNPNSKLAQDLVACFSMGAYRVRTKLRLAQQEEDSKTNNKKTNQVRDRRHTSRNRTYGRDPRR